MIDDKQAIIEATEYHKKNKMIEHIDVDNITTKEEEIFGKSYFTVVFPLNDLGKEILKSNYPFRTVVDLKTGKVISSRRTYRNNTIQKGITFAYRLPYITLFVMILAGYFFRPIFSVIAYLLPLFTGFTLFMICYHEMKDYLKKMADFFVILSGTIGASFLVLPFFINDQLHLKSINLFINSHDHIFSPAKFGVIEVFIMFYTIKCLVAFSELFTAREEWVSEQQKRTKLRQISKSFKNKRKYLRPFFNIKNKIPKDIFSRIWR
ncbi:Uncharacterised protein [Klebsiella quasipneumoniae]|uniref:hypothetical protein n=1 Tax=Klebsiella quasipneumoniae TaxID=1463165 RepID=UPI000A0EF8AD|nr:hypothetical protein [Klebsiella quasipneumoniae]SMG73502.1 Uncharacterised protein [Klebsiella quasipneumoniae]